MLDVQVRRPVAPADRTTLQALATAALAVDGFPSLGDAVWRDLEHPGPDTTVVVASDGTDPVGAVHAAPADDTGAVTAGVVVHPDRRSPETLRALLEAFVDDASGRGVVRLGLWLFGADPASDQVVRGSGFRTDRELWQLRVALPLAETARWPDGITVRTFEPGRDEEVWLAINNRSFAADPDQGGWDLETLRAREEESWFDPDGFLLAFDDTGLAGFCWTKIHPPTPPADPEPLGEIYVIGVDPDRQGIGLGRALVVGGLASLHERGTPIGMLFVDAANTPAVGLYRALGFEVARADRSYRRDLP